MWVYNFIENIKGEDSRWISNPGFSEDAEPDPEFAGMFWDEIVRELWYIDMERYYQEQAMRGIDYW